MHSFNNVVPVMPHPKQFW